MHGDAGQDGANAAFIMTESGATLSEAYYTIIQDNELQITDIATEEMQVHV